jgi:hyperosmotically inducible periplasmic protein
MRLSRQDILNVALAALAALVLSACAGTETKRSTGEYTDDTALTAKVKSAIATDVGARTAAAINIETYRGVVQLTGFVSSSDDAKRAEAAAKKVDGVRQVKNDVRVRPSS